MSDSVEKKLQTIHEKLDNISENKTWLAENPDSNNHDNNIAHDGNNREEVEDSVVNDSTYAANIAENENTVSPRAALIARIACVCTGSNNVTGIYLPFIEDNATKYHGGTNPTSLEAQRFGAFIDVFCRLSASSAYIVLHGDVDHDIDEFIAMFPDYGPVKQLLFVSDNNKLDSVDGLCLMLGELGIKCLYDGRIGSSDAYADLFSDNLKATDFPIETLVAYSRCLLNEELARFRAAAATVLSGRGCSLVWLNSDEFAECAAESFRSMIVDAKRCTASEATSEIATVVSAEDKIRADGYAKVIARYEVLGSVEFQPKPVLAALPELQSSMLDAAKAIAAMYERAIEDNLTRELDKQSALAFLHDYAEDNGINARIAKLAKGKTADDVL